MIPALRKSATIFSALSLLSIPAKSNAAPSDWATASDIGRDALVVAALAAPAVSKDWQGVKQAGLSLAVTGGVTYALKETIPERRPDGSDEKSFPSGHTSISFASAATLQRRFGWKVGAPAHLVAAFVGAARVQADKHYVHDVLVGAAIGEAAGLLLTDRRNQRLTMVPWGDAHGGGMMVAARF